MIHRLSRGQVEHKGRRRLVQRLLLHGPLSAWALASDTGRSVTDVGHHLEVLCRIGAVEPIGPSRLQGDEITYSLNLDGLPDWAREGLMGKFSTALCLEIVRAIAIADDGLDVAGVAERTGLSEDDARRYLLFLDAVGVVVYASAARCEHMRMRRALRGHGDLARWRVFFGRLKEARESER